MGTTKNVRRRSRDGSEKGTHRRGIQIASSQISGSQVGSNEIFHPRTRRADAVERLNQTECLFSTSMETAGNPSTFAMGTMFLVAPNSPLDILTIEFYAQEEKNMTVQVYYKEGNFSGVTNDPSQWTKLADSVARPMPGTQYAVIPAADFTPASLNAGIKYSFYIHLAGGSNILKVQSAANSLIGDTYFTDALGLLSLEVGVALDNGPFPSSFAEPAQFAGRIDYESKQTCDSVRTSTIVELQFAVNAEPTSTVMSDLSAAVQEAIQTVMTSDPKLIAYEDYASLEFGNVDSAFMGRSMEKCPVAYATCSLIYARVTFLHLPTVTPGEVTLQILSDASKIADSVVSHNLVETQYVGDPVFRLDFIITLNGVPTATPMNKVQKRYFDVVTAGFLEQAMTNITIYSTEVTGDTVTGGQAGRRLIRTNGLRGISTRRLQAQAALQVVTTISGASSSKDNEITSAILQGFGGSTKQYLEQLATQQLRPGNINDGNSGDMFANLSGAQIIVKPDNYGATRPPAAVTASQAAKKTGKRDNLIWICLAAVVFALAVIYLAYRIYRDFFYAPREKKMQLDVAGRRSGPPSRRPSLDGSRRPSFEGRRPSLERPSNGLSRSEHSPRRPTPMDPLMAQSAHVPRTTSRSPPRNMAGEKGRGVKPSRSLPMDLRRRPQTNDGSADKTTERSTVPFASINQAGQQRGVRPNRSLPMMARQPKSDDRSVHSSASQKPAPTRSPLQRSTQPPPPKNQAGQQRGVRPNRSMPTLKRPGPPNNSDDQSLASKRSTCSLKAGNEAGQQRGIKPSRSMPMMKKPLRGNEGSGHSRNSIAPGPQTKKQPTMNQAGDQRGVNPRRNLLAGEGKNHAPKNQAGQQRGVLPSRSLPMMKKVPVAKSTTDQTIPSSSGHSIRSVPNVTKHPPKIAIQQLPAPSGHSVMSAPRLSTKKHPPKNTVQQLPTSSGHSVRSAPGLSTKKHPPKTQPLQKRPPASKASTSGAIPGSSGHSVKSLPNIPKHPSKNQLIHKPRPVDNASKGGGIPRTSPHSVRTTPGQKVQKHSPVNQAGDARGVKPSRSLPISKRVAGPGQVTVPAKKIVSNDEPEEVSDIESSEEESSSEESDFDESLPIIPVSLKGKSTQPTKDRSIPARPETQRKPPDDSESSEESDFEDYIKSAAKQNGQNIAKSSKPSQKVAEKVPLNQAGKNRGVTKSKSLPPDLTLQQIRLRDMVVKSDSDESNSSESEDGSNAPPTAIFKKLQSGMAGRGDDTSDASSITASISSRNRKVVGGKVGKVKFNPGGKTSSLSGANKVIVPVNLNTKKNHGPSTAKPVVLAPVKVNVNKIHRPPEAKPVTKQEIQRGQLRMSASDERRGAIASHLKGILGDEGNLPP